MQTRFTAVVLALSGAFLASCSDSVTEPNALAPEVSFARPANPGGGGGETTTDADSSATFYFPESGYGITADGAFSDGSTSEYEDNVCGVQATIYDPSGDAVIDTNDASGGAKKCADFPRKLSIDYDGGGVDEQVAVFLNVQGIGSMSPGDSGRYPMNIGLEGSSRCESLKLRESEGGDDVAVTRNGDGTWTVSTHVEDEVSHATAVCFNNGVADGTYEITVSFAIRATGPES